MKRINKIMEITKNMETQIKDKNNEPKFLRAKELAEYFRIGESTVWYYLKKGKIESKKLSPRVTVFNVKEAEKFLGC